MQVRCGGTQCGGFLGEIGVSILGVRNYSPMWKIRPGWHFVQGVLTFTDYTRLSERKLAHAALPQGVEKPPQGMGLEREAGLPLRVKCPHCDRVRWVSPELGRQAIYAAAGPSARPQPAFA